MLQMCFCPGVTLRGTVQRHSWLWENWCHYRSGSLAAWITNLLAGWPASRQLIFNLPTSPKLHRSNYIVRPRGERAERIGTAPPFLIITYKSLQWALSITISLGCVLLQSQKCNTYNWICTVSLRSSGNGIKRNMDRRSKNCFHQEKVQQNVLVNRSSSVWLFVAKEICMRLTLLYCCVIQHFISKPTLKQSVHLFMLPLVGFVTEIGASSLHVFLLLAITLI